MNAMSWRGPIDVDVYLRREAHLRTTELNRDGGVTYWILVDTAAATGSDGIRRILSSCETIRKQALIAHSDDPCIRVALVPDAKSMQWHHAREEFLAQELLGRLPLAKGALTTTSDEKRAWCIWTRTFGAGEDENILHILRLVVEGENSCNRQAINVPSKGSRHGSHQPMVIAIASILRAAQLEASNWGMASVQFWNPSPLSVLAAEYLDPLAKITCREDESLTSLRWHKESPSDPTRIDWISNEKYGWC
ncbi:MAG: hypothetical protein LQ350_000168 [Teloschistes chrysophthalmus]|nr:MAG: hypothetical protein LQ350_000168 [Niorma chrysophthalma]